MATLLSRSETYRMLHGEGGGGDFHRFYESFVGKFSAKLVHVHECIIVHLGSMTQSVQFVKTNHKNLCFRQVWTIREHFPLQNKPATPYYHDSGNLADLLCTHKQNWTEAIKLV